MKLSIYFSIFFFSMLTPCRTEAKIIFVNTNVQGGAQDGSSWANAYPLLQSALLVAQYGDTIWVAAGTYHPTTGTNRYISFILKNGVKIYGGFTGVESSLDERDWELNETVLSGDIGVPGDSTDNSYTVVYCDFVDSTTVVDGFIITGGNADNDAPFLPATDRSKSGGGMYLNGTASTEESRLAILNCKFMSNNALNNGGGLYLRGGNGSAVTPRLENCVFSSNKARNGGGVARVESGMVKLEVLNCEFSNNSADFGGGILQSTSNVEVDISFEDCLFTGNFAVEGAGFYCDSYVGGVNLEFLKCVFEGNYSGGNSDGIVISYYDLLGSQNNIFTVESCNFIENEPDTTGGRVIYYISFGRVSIIDFLFEENNCGAIITGGDSVIIDNASFINNVGLDQLISIGSNDFASIDSAEVIGNTNLKNDNLIFVRGSSAIANSVFIDNNGAKFDIEEAGLLRYYGGSIGEISNCYFVNNKTNNVGACVIIDASANVTVNNSNFISNSAEKNGGVFVSNGYINLNVLNSTFFNNKAKDLGSIMICRYIGSSKPSIELTNNIFVSSLQDSLIYMFDTTTPGGTVEFSANNNLFSTDSCVNLAPFPLNCGPNNLFGLDPMFLDTAAGDYRLHPCSPARDAGDNAIIDSLGILTDIAGQPRIQGGVVDMGAWESEAFSIRTDSVQAAPCAGAPGSLWLDLDTGCPPFFIALGTDTTISDTSRFQLPLPAGTHTLVITDGRMDTDTLQITVPGAPPLLASLTGTDVICPDTAGTASLSPLGGTAPYTYLWSNGDTAATATGLPAGLHTVTLTDANGCTLTDSVEISTSGHLTLGISIQPISCHDSADGVAAITPQDGNWPYSWLWNDGNTDSLRTDIAGGNYSVTVTDALGCTDELSFFLPAPDSLQATASATPAACASQATGSATANATGGTAPYSYQWSNSSTFQTIENLSPGWYSVTVTDIKGCQDTAGVLVQSPPALSLSIAGATTVCPGDSTLLAAQVAGGTPPYSYQWNTPGIPPGDSSITVGPGNYSLTVVDANGCSKTTSHIVSEDPPIEILSEVQPVTNPNQPNGAVEVQLTFGGTPPYSYQWSHGPTTASVDSLAAGEYSLTITDALGCTETFTFEVLLTSTKNPAAAELQALIVPNPSGSAGARLQLSGPWPQHLLLSLHDTHGRLLWRRSVLRSEEINLPGKNTPTGSYWLLLRSEEGEILRGLKWVVVE